MFGSINLRLFTLYTFFIASEGTLVILSELVAICCLLKEFSSFIFTVLLPVHHITKERALPFFVSFLFEILSCLLKVA